MVPKVLQSEQSLNADGRFRFHIHGESEKWAKFSDDEMQELRIILGHVDTEGSLQLYEQVCTELRARLED